MPTRPEPPKTGLGLLDSILGDPARARRAVFLMLAGAVAVGFVLAPVLIVVCLFGTTGAVAVGGVGTLATAGCAFRGSRRRAGGAGS
ncbi:MAG TPA: hypothetical protein VGX25_05255 [Actinophytocola sp.]|uniref:hypothetical protein n=1 Tax=Actinophytocola sp. TaxID=1872138 RepID=UPI002DDCC518|nr:hypothetical protein [Actinophytocola sp.]HEV2778789.1 hypothetical protein [Actinophytocola sp.]